MGRIILKESTVLPTGLQYDRRWMLVDGEGKFVTQRSLPEMARVKFEWTENGFDVSYSGVDHGAIKIPFEMPSSPAFSVQVWDDKVAARAMSKEINDWFSGVFVKKCQLVRMEDNAIRKSTIGKPDKLSSFADITPFLIIGESSLNDLNGKMKTPIPISRFRPNFVFSGGDAFVEDKWDEFKIGDILFKKYKKCGRCKVTTIDQDTGEKRGEEPLETLGKYRKEDRQLNFGIRASLGESDGKAVVKLNDEVKAL